MYGFTLRLYTVIFDNYFTYAIFRNLRLCYYTQGFKYRAKQCLLTILTITVNRTHEKQLNLKKKTAFILNTAEP